MFFQEIQKGDSTLSPCISILASLCEQKGLKLFLDNPYRYSGYFLMPSGKRSPILGTAFALNSQSAAAIASDKDYCAKFLKSAGLPAPDGILIHSPAAQAALAQKRPKYAASLNTTQDAEAFAKTKDWPVFVKPNDGSQGQDVHRAENSEALHSLCNELFEHYECLLVQEAISGADYRIIVIDGEVPLVVERRPLSVIGDGKRTLHELATEKLEISKTYTGAAKIQLDDSRINKFITSQNLSFQRIVPEGTFIQLLSNANLSTGGEAIDQTVMICEQHRQLAINAAKACGLRYAGIDLLCPDISDPTQPAAVLEVNASPGLMNFSSINEENREKTRHIYEILLARLIEEDH